MFLKAFDRAISHTGIMTQVAKAGICYSKCNRWKNHSSEQKINPHLLYNFSKDNTLKIMAQAQETADPSYRIDQKDLITFDKLSENMNSETHRVFDLYHKKFFALKTLSLDSELAWKQINLMLRQYLNERSRLAPVHSFSYDEEKNEMKILSGIQKTTIGDYAFCRKRQGLIWSTQELKTVLWHLLKIIRALKLQGASTDYLKAGDIFFDSKEGKLRAFDYPGASIGSWGWSYWNCRDDSFNVAIHTLVQIIDPYAPVDNSEEARAYLNINHPEFKSELERHSRRHSLLNQDLVPLEQIFESQVADNFLINALKKNLDEKHIWNTQENWAFVNQGLGKFDEASLILKNILNENANKYGSTHPTVTKSYLDLAELYLDQGNYELSSEYFQNAFNSSHTTPVLDKEILARLYFKYGKLLLKLNQENNKPAMNEFQKAHDLLKDSLNGSVRLKEDVQKTLDDLNDPGYFNHENWEKRRWRKRKVLKIILALICIKIIYSKWRTHDLKHCRKSEKQDSQIEPCRAPSSPQNYSPKVEPGVTMTVNVKSVQSNSSPVPVTPGEAQQDSKLAWFLFGLNVVIGFAGLTLPSAN